MILCTLSDIHTVCQFHRLIFPSPAAPFNSCIGRLRGSGLARAGWVPVATAPDEYDGNGVEMSGVRR